MNFWKTSEGGGGGGGISDPKNFVAVFSLKKLKVCHGKVNSHDFWRPKVNDRFDSV